MTRRSPGALAVLFACLALPGAAAAEDDQVLEHVVVRNRLFQVKHRAEASASLGLMPVSKLVDHYNLNLSAAYNFTEVLALEARGGYALAMHTGLANRIADNFLARDPALGAQREVDDLADLWEMNFNAIAGARWAPLYGKISLMAELPVHFQAYLWGGGGIASLKRQSLVYCLAADRTGAGASCSSWLTETRAAPLASAALGVRFFTHAAGSIDVELRSYHFVDQYRTGIDRVLAEQGDRSTGTEARRGITTLVLFNLGYSLFF